VRRRDKTGRVLVLPNQTAGLIEQYGLSRTQVDREVWAVAADGTRWRGAAAANQILREIGGGWAWLAAVYRFAPVRWIEDCAYRWAAEHRTWLSRWWGVPPEWRG
jgi:predicted DCC family thiol-disulfide oxidoreductase YuxK